MVEAKPVAINIVAEDEEMKNEESSAPVQTIKDKPVEIRVIEQEKFYVWSDINNQTIRTLSKTIFVKRMNNFIKTLLIKEAVGFKKELSVLDLCCGVGGDLQKWQKQNIAHYVGSDLSSKCVIEA